MNLNKYLIIDLKEDYDPGFGVIESFCFYIVQGFTRDNAEEALNIQKGWQPLDNDLDKLFFFPGCNVPRFKVREAYTCTIKPERATAAFISKNDLIGSDSTFKYYKNVHEIEINKLKPFVKHMIDETTKKMFNAITTNFDKAYLTQKLWDDRYYSKKFTKNGDCLCDVLMGKWTIKNYINSSNQLLAFNRRNNLDKMSCDIFLEEEVLLLLNKDNIVIDAEKYQELRSFGNTFDKENLILMMELMSNSDFKKSIVYLLLLLKEFGSSIKSFKETQHINFKSLLSFLSINQDELDKIHLPALTNCLKKHKQFTLKNAYKLSRLFAGEHVNYNNQDNIMWQEGPVLKPDYEDFINIDIEKND
jgi:hypothetical protein